MKKIIISDCDGILTNGSSIYTSDGKIAKIYGSYDTEAIKLAYENNWEILFVSNDSNGWDITKKRLDEYKKRSWCNYQLASAQERKELVKDYKDKGYFVVFAGDSISDIEAGLESNLFCTTNNGFDEVKSECDFISSREGGNGGFASIIYYVDKYVKQNINLINKN